MIIELQGYKITLPDPPPKEEIDGYNLPIEEQYWKKPYNLTDEEYLSLPEDEQDEIVERENDRRVFGYWFMNKGKLFYLTGDNYFFLTFWTIDGQPPQFIINQAKNYYFEYLVDNDPYCFGSIELKPRREGRTQRKLSALVNRATLVKNKHFGIQSKTGDDAKNVNFLNLVLGYRNLPVWIHPQQSGMDIPKKELVFDKPSKRSALTKKTGVKDFDEEDSPKTFLKTKIDWGSTVESYYDGKKLYRYLMDECLAKGTKILCENMEFKPIEKIKVGDKVIVEGGKLVEVGKAFNGYDEMFLVRQPYGKDYIVNSKHRLYLEQRRRRGGRDKCKDVISILTPSEYTKLSPYDKRTIYRVTSSGLDFEYNKPIIDPYLLGIWLGDGKRDALTIIVNIIKDEPIYNWLMDYCTKYNLLYSVRKCDSDSCIYFSVLSKAGYPNPHIQALKKMGIYKNKRIPKEYLLNSREVRLKLLAGLIDTDGYLSNGNSYSFGISKKELVEDIKILAESLGYSVSRITEKTTNLNTKAYLVAISGNISTIPCLVERKALKHIPYYKSRKCKMSVEPIGYGEYFGIQLKTDNDNDRRLILEDFTLTMNCGKWSSANAYETWGIVKKCLMDGFDIIGKAYLFSTIGETDEVAADNFIKLWNESDAAKDKRTPNGYTISGLYRYFIPSYSTKRGKDPRTGKELINKYGEVDEVAARELILNERKSIKDPRKLFIEIKQNPLTIEEALHFGSNSSIFDNMRLNNRYNALKDFQPSEERPVKYLVGNLGWENNEKYSKVHFIPNENGKWKISYLPNIAGSTMTNRVKRLPNGTCMPFSDTQFIMGIDPFDYDAEDMTTTTGSKGAFHIKLKYNFEVPDLSYIYCCQYFYREADARMFYDDVAKTMFFYGARINPERKLYGIWRYLKDNGLLNFSMIRPDMTKQSDFQKRDNGYGTPTGEDTKRLGAELWENYMAAPDPMDNEHFMDNLDRFWFEESIEQLMKYNPKESTKYDLVMSLFMTEIGSQSIKKLQTNKSKPKEESIADILFPRYDNSGVVARPIPARMI